MLKYLTLFLLVRVNDNHLINYRGFKIFIMNSGTNIWMYVLCFVLVLVLGGGGVLVLLFYNRYFNI